MRNKIEEIKEVLRSHIPGLTLRKPATLEQISETERHIDVQFPPELADLYLQHDGEDWREFVGLMAGRNFMSLESIVREHETGLYTLTLDDEPSIHPCLPEKTIRPDRFCQGWIPFAGSSTGNYIAVDLSPGEAGTIGQIILFGVDDPIRIRLSANISEFLDLTLSLFQQKRCHSILDPDGLDIYGIGLERFK